METINQTRYLSLLLTFVAGFCDTVTFIAADEVFSAHVTGNFIVFAYDLVNQSDAQAWMKLLTFPVFIAAVMLSGWLARKSGDKYALLLAEGILLLISGIAAFAAAGSGIVFPWLTKVLTLLIVVAMGFQNTFSKLFSKETYGPTTVMTGNVTQAALDLAGIFTSHITDPATKESLKKQLIILSGFLLGCLLGAIAAKQIGLGIVLLPGVALIIQFSRSLSLHVYQHNN